MYMKSIEYDLLNTNSFLFLFHSLVGRRDESHFHWNCSQITWHVRHNHIYSSCFSSNLMFWTWKNIVIMFVKIFCDSFDRTNLGRTFVKEPFQNAQITFEDETIIFIALILCVTFVNRCRKNDEYSETFFIKVWFCRNIGWWDVSLRFSFIWLNKVKKVFCRNASISLY